MLGFLRALVARRKTLTVYLLLGAAVALSVFGHSMVFNEWAMPTYGNTMIHVASERHLVEHGFYPLQDDYSYGGGNPNTYVPIYRFTAASAVVLTGLDYDLVGRLFAIAFALLLPLGFFALARALYDEWAGLAAAFLASLVPELLIYTVRPLPQGMGLALLPVAFYLIYKGFKWPALLLSVLVVLVHQEAGVFLVGVAAAFFALKALQAFGVAWEKKQKIEIDKRAWLALGCWLAGVLAYVAWHFFVLGNANIFGLAQFEHHEGNAVDFDLLLGKTGNTVVGLSVLGLLFLFLRAARDWRSLKPEVFVLAICGAGLFAIKNDLVGINVFMDRFIVFLALGLIVLAAFGLVQSVRAIKKIVPGLKEVI